MFEYDQDIITVRNGGSINEYWSRLNQRADSGWILDNTVDVSVPNSGQQTLILTYRREFKGGVKLVKIDLSEITPEKVRDWTNSGKILNMVRSHGNLLFVFIEMD